MIGQSEAGLLNSIYEAGAAPSRWGSLLDSLGAAFGARGGLLFNTDGNQMIGSAAPLAMGAEFVEAGYMAVNHRPAEMLRCRHPGFQTDIDLCTEEQLRTHPMFTDFLIPRGYVSAAGTAILGAGLEDLLLTFEGFPSHAAAQAAVPGLNLLRPHLARAAALSGQLKLREARAAATALQVIGVPAAVIDAWGRVLAANPLLDSLVGEEVFDYRSGVKFANRHANVELSGALERARRGMAFGRSIPLPAATESASPRVAHLVPAAGVARDIFGGQSLILLMTSVTARASVGASLLEALFDFTPAEALVAKALTDGVSVTQIAASRAVSVQTVRVQVREILAKTRLKRQTDLIRMLSGMTLPGMD